MLPEKSGRGGRQKEKDRVGVEGMKNARMCE